MRIRTTIASAALLSFGAGAASAASVTKSIDVDAPPAKVWAMIGPFCSISAWHPAIGKCTTDGNAEPTRTLVTIDGKATFVEIETARDEKGMSYSYAIKSSPLPLSDYKSTIKVEPKGEGLSTITWSSTFTPAAGKEANAEEALRANDDETNTCREFTLGGIGQTSSGYAQNQRQQDSCSSRR